jgi:hypothetical protein
MEISAQRNNAPKPPVAGIIYGEIAYWVAMIGITIALIGSTVYLALGGYFNETSLFKCLWEGDTTSTIWSRSTSLSYVPHGFWYIHSLTQGDCIAMLGVVVACVAAVVGMWAVVYKMARDKDGIFTIFSLIVAVILTLGVFGY